MKSKKSCISKNSIAEFEKKIALAFNECYTSIDFLHNEQKRMIETSAILFHSVKALKGILVDKKLIKSNDFDEAFNDAITHTTKLTKSSHESQIVDSKKLYNEYILKNVPPAHS